jgi:hypothetical protein
MIARFLVNKTQMRFFLTYKTIKPIMPIKTRSESEYENCHFEGFSRRPAPEGQVDGGADGHITQGVDYQGNHGIHQESELIDGMI